MTRIITWEPDMPALGRAVVAIGVFDGVHLGHQRLVASALELAAGSGSQSVVLTFDRDPDRVVMPDRAAPQLLELEDKVRLLSALGPDAVIVVPFDTTLAGLTPDAFVDTVLCSAMTPTTVVVGRDFRYGTMASGDIGTLAGSGSARGFDVLGHDLLMVDGIPVTSTRIRAAIAAGEVGEAARLLGRPHFVAGRVTHGRGAGHALGAPTANVATHSWTALPADGVYAGRTHVGAAVYDCAISVGLPPSFPGAADRLEAHLIDYDGPSLYGETLHVEFVARIRELFRFDDRAELAEAIAGDIETVRALLGES